MNKTTQFMKLRFILVFTFVFLDFLFVLTQHGFFSSRNSNFLFIFDKLTCFVLFLNFLFNLTKSEDKFLTFVKSHIFDIIAFIPFGLIYFRLFSIITLYNLFKSYHSSKKEFIQENILPLTATLTLFYFIILTLFLVYVDPNFSNIFESFWFNIVTASSVGYGDVVPATFLGKLSTVVTVLLTSLLISIFTAHLSAYYNKKSVEEKRGFILDYIKHLNNDCESLENNFDEIDMKLNSIERDIENLRELVK